MAESSSDSGATEHNATKSTPAHRALHYTKSSPTFHSMEYLTVKNQEILLEGQRSRSNSAPMSREAMKVAKDLREASDYFFNVRAKRKVVSRQRRRTLGSFMHQSIEKELLQATLQEEDESGIPLLGTPV